MPDGNSGIGSNISLHQYFATLCTMMATPTSKNNNGKRCHEPVRGNDDADWALRQKIQVPVCVVPGSGKRYFFPQRMVRMAYVGIYYPIIPAPSITLIPAVDELATLLPPRQLYLLALCPRHSDRSHCCKGCHLDPSRRRSLSKLDLNASGRGDREQWGFQRIEHGFQG